MKRLITNISKQYLNNKQIIKLNNLNRTFISINSNNIPIIQQQSYNQLFNNNNNNIKNCIINNNNNNNNNNGIILNKRYYCNKAPNNNNSQVTDAEIDIHREDDDPNGEYKSTEVNGIRIEPKYYIEFTCTYVDPSGDGSECGFVSRKTFSKHAYHKGVVLIRCDGCKKIHTIADNLGWTGYENAKNIEEIMKEKGEEVRKYLLKGEKIFPHDSVNNADSASSSDGPILIGSSNSNENVIASNAATTASEYAADEKK